MFCNIARALDEHIKFKNTIDRLCDRCFLLPEEEQNIIKNNYIDLAIKRLPDDEIILIKDDSDVNKEYSK